MSITFRELLPMRLKEAREKKGFSQNRLAEEVCITSASISGYENGKGIPSIGVLREIAQACEVSMDWLCGIDEPTPKIKNFTDLIIALKNIGDCDIFHIVNEIENDPYSEPTDIVGLSIFRVASEVGENNEKDALINFFIDWKKMRDVLDSGAIDEEVYDLWFEKTLRKYADMELPSDEISLPF